MSRAWRLFAAAIGDNDEMTQYADELNAKLATHHTIVDLEAEAAGEESIPVSEALAQFTDDPLLDFNEILEAQARFERDGSPLNGLLRIRAFLSKSTEIYSECARLLRGIIESIHTDHSDWTSSVDLISVETHEHSAAICWNQLLSIERQLDSVYPGWRS